MKWRLNDHQLRVIALNNEVNSAHKTSTCSPPLPTPPPSLNVTFFFKFGLFGGTGGGTFLTVGAMAFDTCAYDDCDDDDWFNGIDDVTIE